MATIVFNCGFECGAPNLVNVGGTTLHHFIAQSNATISTTTFRTDLRAGRVNPTAAIGYFNSAVPVSNTHVIRGYVRFTTLPNENASVFVEGLFKNGAWFQASDNKIYSGHRAAGSVVVGSTGVSVTTGVWYRIDVKVDQSANPHLIDVSVDGTACAQLSSAQATSESGEIVAGSDVETFTGDVFFDDVSVSATLADSPLGAGFIKSYIPNADGTHVIAGANDFERTLTGTDIIVGTTTAFQLIAERPLEAVAGDFINAIAPALGTDYVECAFEDSAEAAAPRGVDIVWTAHQAGTGIGTHQIRLRDINGSTEATVVSFNGAGTTALATASVGYPTIVGTANPWTLTAFNALRVRYGFVTDANPDQYLDSVMLEAEYAEVVAAERVPRSTPYPQLLAH